MEERILKIQFAKAGNGGRTARLTIPIKWLDEMELVPEDREVVAVFNPETKEFSIRKKENS
ncbi:MAG: AbrB/MazE/SpoVT family DNA-binding domain-containing protein [Fusobacterium sp.]